RLPWWVPDGQTKGIGSQERQPVIGSTCSTNPVPQVTRLQHRGQLVIGSTVPVSMLKSPQLMHHGGGGGVNGAHSMHPVTALLLKNHPFEQIGSRLLQQ
ncbi:MAG: hypothetical protein ACK51M_18445, partial [Burkholderiales bacterium]